MELSQYIQNGIARLEVDVVRKSKDELHALFKEWSEMAKKVEDERETYEIALLNVKKHLSIMFQRDAPIMNKSTVYTIVRRALDKHSNDTK